jgi:glycosyltransferase involved in cell wall biosynthesis
MRRSVAFVSVVPSPYQRDLLRALAQRPEIDLRVFYLEAAAPDSPWPAAPLAPYEEILLGTWLSLGAARCHVNWPAPALGDFDVVVMNTLMSFTGQWLMRTGLRHQPWIFWGERLRRGGRLHEALSSPLHRATGIAAIGSVAGRDYRERFPAPQHFQIPYHCDLSTFLNAPRRARDDGHVVFLFCGQMIARKGIDLLLAAFSQLGENARLLLVGREAELPAFLSPLPSTIRERIVYAGFQAPEALPHFFAQADVFVLPSRYDGWGVVVNQALGSGLPIICSDAAGAAHDLVEDEVNGLKFPTGDAAALARCMARFIAEPHLIDPWGASSRAKAPDWTPEAGAAKWARAIESVLTR